MSPPALPIVPPRVRAPYAPAVLSALWLAAIVPAAVLHTGCAGTQRLSPAQADATQVRDVDADPDHAFAAATNAVIDAGFAIGVTDAQAGILSAVRREDPSPATQAAVLTLSTLLTGAPVMAPPSFYALGVQVLPRANGHASVRIRPFGHGQPEADRQEIQHLWVLMQRHVILTEPLAPTPDSPRSRSEW